MKNHEYYEELVNLKVDDMLTAEQEAELAEHMAACADCRERLEMYLMVRRLSDELLVEPPEDFTSGVMYKVGLEKSKNSLKKRFLPHIFTIAGAAAAIALLIYSGTFKSVTSPELNLASGAADSAASGAAQAPSEAGSGSDNGAVAMDAPNLESIPQPTAVPKESEKKVDEDMRSSDLFGFSSSACVAENVFDPAKAKVGDQVAGFEITEIEPGHPNNAEDVRIVFEGEATLTGTLYFDNNENAKWGKFIYFYADSESAANLPYPSDDTGEVWFGIDNYNEAVKLLDTAPEDEGKTITYDAVIVINSYTITQDSSDSCNFATLKNIVSFNRIPN